MLNRWQQKQVRINIFSLHQNRKALHRKSKEGKPSFQCRRRYPLMAYKPLLADTRRFA